MRRRRDAVTVRSHRRGGRRRRLVLAPWIVISVVSALVLTGVSTGYAWLVTRGCSGSPVEITVVSSPTLSRILDNLGRRWSATEPSVNGRCVAVEVVSKNSAEVAQALGPNWDPRRDGPRPTVWVPDSTSWLKLASTRDEAARLIPDRQPSLARTPTVLGMPMPMAKAVGWPDAKLSWRQLGEDLMSGKADAGWRRYGRPEWGRFKLGMTSPVSSTAGLHAVTAVADRDDDGQITDAERKVLRDLSRSMHVYADDPSKILGELTKRDPAGEKKVLEYVSAFPILEHDLRAYNDTDPKVPLAAVYPTDGSADADYPYLTLSGAPWAKPLHGKAAHQFLTFLRGPEGRQSFLDNFFRDPNREAGKNLTRTHGVRPRLRTLPRAVLVPESVSLTTATWVAANRPANVLFALDVSQPMAEPVPGTDSDRLDLARTAVARAVALMGGKARAGLWAFSSRLDGDADHLEFTDLGPLSEDSRREAIQADLGDLDAGEAAGAGTYDTALAGYRTVGERYAKNSSNLVVLISSGQDDGKGASLEQAVAKLRDAYHEKRPVHLVTIGYGAQADMASLDKLARATGGRSYHVQYETDIDSVLLTALFNA